MAIESTLEMLFALGLYDGMGDIYLARMTSDYQAVHGRRRYYRTGTVPERYHVQAPVYNMAVL